MVVGVAPDDLAAPLRPAGRPLLPARPRAAAMLPLRIGPPSQPAGSPPIPSSLRRTSTSGTRRRCRPRWSSSRALSTARAAPRRSSRRACCPSGGTRAWASEPLKPNDRGGRPRSALHARSPAQFSPAGGGGAARRRRRTTPRHTHHVDGRRRGRIRGLSLYPKHATDDPITAIPSPEAPCARPPLFCSRSPAPQVLSLPRNPALCSRIRPRPQPLPP